MLVSKYWIAYTNDFKEAKKYRQQYNKLLVLQGKHQMSSCYFNMFHKYNGRYILPSCLWKPVSVTNKQINPNTEIMLLDEQKNALEFVKEKIKEWEKTAMIISETATGKSYMLMATAFAINKPTVIVAPRKWILVGLKDKFQWLADIKVMTSWDIKKWEQLPKVLLITASSFNNVYSTINKNYDVLLLDEVHRLPEKRVQQINMRKWVFVMGVSGTPQRKEFEIEWFKMLFKNIYDTKMRSMEAKILTYEYRYTYSIVEMMKAAEWLPTTHPEALRNLYVNNEDRTKKLWDIIRNMQHIWFKRMIVFTDRTKHINNIYKVLSQHYDKKKIIIMSGQTDIEESIKKANELDEYIIIWQMASSWEGVDINNLQLWILFQSTSRINTVEQAVWRIKRKYEWKEFAYFIDFIDIMKLWESKTKRLWWYDRKKAYKKMNYEITELVPFIKQQVNTLL